MKKLFLFGLSLFIVTFILGMVTWFGFEKNNNKVKTIEKQYDINKINRLIVNSDTADIKVTKGNTFKLVYKGKNKLNISNVDQTLQIAEMSATSKKMVDVNPFANHHGTLKIEVPSTKLKELKLTSNVSNIEVNHINSVNATLWNEKHGEINIDDSQFKSTQISGYETFVKANNSSLTDSEVNIEKGAIDINSTQVNNSVFKVVEGMINLKNMPAECVLKASIKNGDILLHYKDQPHNMMLKLNPENGRSIIKNKNIQNGKNGDGRHKIELYTTNGDIKVE
ncbi:hypothetical protein DOS74_06130 [Staphylococcus felis]|uniref:DUF4097 family beta strand repeat protein n=4 Tax=Staphylococcus felis TaxID=46127 RepID=A0AAX1RUI9_9STAP|nr:DUF4097 family beta strand repeat-containing protein [Staphylococcus felis]MBH9580613.1 DUF4097 family beta strand repeat protein [Staphylococcus felis]MDM8328335.1 DUF4097 family beta strand repeat-containing protein [Staphylococcus felis]MDQ7193435.1 DUF4097 family beta strand repeat-containing protein [Staphylococcus felis]REH80071.1 hypothetical protein DOS59_02360 [Staphylococcus felis]REH83969.1 hypothetical protein DOS56_05090 [Staphylococcus felis]